MAALPINRLKEGDQDKITEVTADDIKVDGEALEMITVADKERKPTRSSLRNWPRKDGEFKHKVIV